MKLKRYSTTAAHYAEKLRAKGYTVKFNWVDSESYENITICGPIFCGYGCEFSTPRQAHEYITRQKF